MLWFHHVPWTYTLKSGDTVIQHFYNAHYAGAETAQIFHNLWSTIKDRIDAERFEHVLYRLRYQAGHSIIWRDAICMFYRKMTSIEDKNGRVGKHPYRIEAESMQLSGYSRAGVSPAEMASSGAAVTARGSSGTATAKLDLDDGVYDVGINYFDVSGGSAKWQVSINDEKLGEFVGDIERRMGKTTSGSLDGHTAARWTFNNVKIKKGDTIKVVGSPNGQEAAPLDYIVLLPPGVVD
jgi:alpha-glucuronidase